MSNQIQPDKYQSEVISSPSKRILVRAGAGSGKTFTLLTRIHSLVSYKKVDPSCILVLTFTRVAAMHIRESYIKHQDSTYDEVPDFCTFHSFCYKTLCEYPAVLKELGYSKIPVIASDEDIKRYQMQAKHAVGASSLSNRVIQNPDLATGKAKFLYERYKKAFDVIVSNANCIDYDTLCNSVCKLFKENAECIESVKQRYKYVFVDEFQDTDKYQFDFVSSLSNANVVLCGDALQNIYQFRGCSNKIMKDIIDSDSWDVRILPVNYRSTVNICSYVNRISSSFKSKKYGVDLVSALEGPSVRECRVSSQEDFYADVAQYVQALKSKGSVACLFRTNREVDQCMAAFLEAGINCSSTKSQSYVVDVLKCVEDEEFRYAFYCACLSDLEYEQYSRLRSAGYSDKEMFKLGEFKSIEVLKTQVDSLLDAMHALTPCAFFQCVSQAAGVSCSNDMEFESCEEALVCAANRASSKSLSGNVYVGTIHSVKGLEFDSVAVCGVGGKSFRINSEENENLLYTACTRAKSNLIVFKHCN